MPPLQVGSELPDADAIRARLDYLDEERKLLRQLLTTTILLEGRKPLVAPRPNATAREAAHAAR